MVASALLVAPPGLTEPAVGDENAAAVVVVAATAAAADDEDADSWRP